MVSMFPEKARSAVSEFHPVTPATLQEEIFMNKRTISSLILGSAIALAASSAQAAVVDNWDFVLDMKWDITPGKTIFTTGLPGTSPGAGLTGIAPTEISWGAAYGTFFNKDPYKARSGFRIHQPHVTGNIGTSFAGQPVTTVDANMFTHYNGDLSGTFKTLKQASMDVTVQLKLPGTNDTVVNLNKTFDVHFYETTNFAGQCEWGPCANDVFAVISEMDLVSTFTYAGVQYTLNYFETTNQIKPLSDAACIKMGFSDGSCYGFTTPEDRATTVKFNFSITAVPEPETWAMLLAGLGIVGMTAKRRNRQK